MLSCDAIYTFKIPFCLRSLMWLYICFIFLKLLILTVFYRISLCLSVCLFPHLSLSPLSLFLYLSFSRSLSLSLTRSLPQLYLFLSLILLAGSIALGPLPLIKISLCTDLICGPGMVNIFIPYMPRLWHIEEAAFFLKGIFSFCVIELSAFSVRRQEGRIMEAEIFLYE